MVLAMVRQGDLLPLPPPSHHADAYKEASEQVPEAVEEAGQNIGQAEVGCDVHTHDAVEGHQVQRAINNEDVPATHCNE